MPFWTQFLTSCRREMCHSNADIPNVGSGPKRGHWIGDWSAIAEFHNDVARIAKVAEWYAIFTQKPAPSPSQRSATH